MNNLFKKQFKEQKGFTLIELLAVIVILGIILAIAIPAVSSIIENSRIDAHISNAQQIESSAKLYFADNPSADNKVTYGKLKEEDLLDEIEDPHTDNEYAEDNTFVTKEEDGSYKTTLVGEGEDGETYFSGESAADYTRDDFVPNQED